jgi:hypothetical protein
MLELLKACGALAGCVLLLVGVVLGVDALWTWIAAIWSNEEP